MRPYRAFRGYGIVLSMMIATPDLDTLNEQQLRALARTLLATVSEKEALLSHKDHDIRFKEATIAKLTHEIAVLRRYQFGKKSEQISGEQGSLLEEAVAADIAAIERELEQLTSTPKIADPRAQPKRAALPPQLPRIEIHHEPENTACACGCQLTRVGQDPPVSD